MAGYGAPANPLESAPPFLGPTPPDARPLTLRDHLQAAMTMILVDRQLDSEEMSALHEFVQSLQQVQAAQMTMNGGMGAMVQQQMRSSSPGPMPQPNTVDYGAYGVPKYGGM